MLDLGAAPGSWSLYSAERVGPGGRVVAVDLTEIKQAFPPNVTVLRADVFEIAEGDAVSASAPYDVVVSDMAPNTSGSKISDQARSYELFMKAVSVASSVGKAGSHFVGKIFMSDDFPKAREAVRVRYAKVQVIRPEGTRTGSSEIFVVGLGLRAR